MKLNPNKAAGVDSIPARLLTSVANELANPVSWLFNLSFTRAIVPQLWKQANIPPIYKDEDTGSVTNYRGDFIIICCWEVSRKDTSYCYI